MKRREDTPVHVEYFYIMENSTGYLVSGVARKSYAHERNSITYTGKGKYEWARRFTSVETAKAYVEQFDMRGTSIIDAAGRVRFIYPEWDECEVVSHV